MCIRDSIAVVLGGRRRVGVFVLVFLEVQGKVKLVVCKGIVGQLQRGAGGVVVVDTGEAGVVELRAVAGIAVRQDFVLVGVVVHAGLERIVLADAGAADEIQAVFVPVRPLPVADTACLLYTSRCV